MWVQIRDGDRYRSEDIGKHGYQGCHGYRSGTGYRLGSYICTYTTQWVMRSLCRAAARHNTSCSAGKANYENEFHIYRSFDKQWLTFVVVSYEIHYSDSKKIYFC